MSDGFRVCRALLLVSQFASPAAGVRAAFGPFVPGILQGAVPQVRPAVPISQPVPVRRPPIMVLPEDASSANAPLGFQASAVKPLYLDADSVIQEWMMQAVALKQAGGSVSELSAVLSMKSALATSSRQEIHVLSIEQTTRLPANVFALVSSTGAKVEDVSAMAVVRLRQEAWKTFADMELEQLKKHRSTERGSVSVVEVTEIVQAPALVQRTDMIDELMRRIIRWSWAQDFLVVVTPENSEAKARYELLGFRDSWIGSWKMVYGGEAPAEPYDERGKEMVDLSMATDLQRQLHDMF